MFKISKDRHSLFETSVCWLLTGVIGFIIIKDIVFWCHFIPWQGWSNIGLWKGLAICILFHSCVAGLAFLYRRILPQLSFVFIYLNLQLFFYLLFLIKGLAFKGLPDQTWWLIIFVLLLVLLQVLPKKDKWNKLTRREFHYLGKQ